MIFARPGRGMRGRPASGLHVCLMNHRVGLDFLAGNVLRVGMVKTHGMSSDPAVAGEYTSWREMRRRCLSQRHKRYADYGGRGLTICDQWSDFGAFLGDMGPRPPGLSLDRIDNGAGYSPENCRWATTKEQNRNQRTNKIVLFGGEKIGMADLAEREKVPLKLMRNRILRKGMTPEDAVADIRKHPPKRRTRRWVVVGGARMTLTAAVKALGLPYSAVYEAVARGNQEFWSVARQFLPA